MPDTQFDAVVQMLKTVWPEAIPWVAVAGSALMAAGHDPKPLLRLVFKECVGRNPVAFKDMLDAL